MIQAKYIVLNLPKFNRKAAAKLLNDISSAGYVLDTLDGNRAIMVMDGKSSTNTCESECAERDALIQSLELASDKLTSLLAKNKDLEEQLAAEKLRAKAVVDELLQSRRQLYDRLRTAEKAITKMYNLINGID